MSNDPNIQKKLLTATHTLNKIQKSDVCKFLSNIRIPDDYSSNLSRCAILPIES